MSYFFNQLAVIARGERLTASKAGPDPQDAGEPDTRDDRFAHAAGRTCAACGHVIEPAQAARLRRQQDWVHDLCPAPEDPPAPAAPR